MKTVLFLMWRYDGGGIERFADNLFLCSDSSKVRYDVALCGDVLPDEDRLQRSIGEGRIVHLPLIVGKIGLKKFLTHLHYLLRSNRYDIVHSNLDGYNFYVLRLAKRCSVPIRISHNHTVGSCTNTIKIRVQQFLMRFWATECIACGYKSGAYWYGNKKFFKVIHCGLDTKELAKCACCEKDKNEGLIIGRICNQKNPYFIVDIMNELLKRNEAYHFTWLGGGELRNHIEKYVSDCGIADFVSFIGFTNNVTDYLRKASFLLMPSLIEGLPLGVIEAQIAGLQVFSSDTITEEIDYGRVHFLSLGQTASDWADYIDETMKCNRTPELNDDILGDFDRTIIAEKIISELYNC